jgi:hypothetical protein
VVTTRKNSTAWRRRLLGGGTNGNEELTAVVGALLLILLAVLGVTIVRIGQLMWLHLFLGVLLIGPVGLKLASTGYRFARYYSGSAPYRRKGPPFVALRALAPMVVATTFAVFVTGMLLLFDGPASKDTLALAHKVSFIVWIAATAPHVIGHLAELPGSVRAVHRAEPDIPGLAEGGAGRTIALAGALVGGAVIAIALLPDFGVWTSR